MVNFAEMPADFSKRIHAALRAWWQSQKPDDALALDHLFLARKIIAERPSVSPRSISNEILLNGINLLRQVDEDAAYILEARFLNGETAQAVGFRRNLSEDIIFQNQRAAVEQLAGVIWSQEQLLIKQRRARIEARLESPTYTKLFGVEQKLAEIHALLNAENEPCVLALEGMGGLGKTSFADALARLFAGDIRFGEIGWVSARRHFFQFSGSVDVINDPDLTIAELVDTLIEQFELNGLRHVSDTERFLGLKDFLKSRSSLVIIDNLETIADYESLASYLTTLANPSKFLMTTRSSLHNVSGVYVMTLKQLAHDDALALIRYEAKTRGLVELSNAPESELEPICTVTGGNPLAIKLIIGQIHSLSLAVVLARFKEGSGKPVEALLDFLYTAAWQSLDERHRRVLQAMLLVADDGKLEQIAVASELSEDQAAACLHRLAGLSLVSVNGGLHEKRYSLHQLAQAFVAQQA